MLKETSSKISSSNKIDHTVDICIKYDNFIGFNPISTGLYMRSKKNIENLVASGKKIDVDSFTAYNRAVKVDELSKCFIGATRKRITDNDPFFKAQVDVLKCGKTLQFYYHYKNHPKINEFISEVKRMVTNYIDVQK